MILSDIFRNLNKLKSNYSNMFCFILFITSIISGASDGRSCQQSSSAVCQFISNYQTDIISKEMIVGSVGDRIQQF